LKGTPIGGGMEVAAEPRKTAAPVGSADAAIQDLTCSIMGRPQVSLLCSAVVCGFRLHVSHSYLKRLPIKSAKGLGSRQLEDSSPPAWIAWRGCKTGLRFRIAFGDRHQHPDRPLPVGLLCARLGKSGGSSFADWLAAASKMPIQCHMWTQAPQKHAVWTSSWYRKPHSQCWSEPGV